MIIHSLRLKNYRKHKDTFIEFPDGLFGIVGNNGSGKTTLIEAITYAIYGQHASKTGQELIKREQATSDADCKVELEFSLGTDTYRATRELRGSRQSPYASLYVNNRPEIEGVNPVTRYLSKKIGMDYKSFFTSIFAKQKELDVLSELPPGERKKRILRLLGVDRIDTAIENVKQNKRESDLKIRGIRGTFLDIDKLNSILEELKKQKESNKQKIQSVKIQVQEAKKILLKTKKIKQTSEKKYDKYRKLDKQLGIHVTQKESNKSNLKNRSQELVQIEKAKQELQLIKPKLKSLIYVKSKKENLDKIREKYLQKNQYESQVNDINLVLQNLQKERNQIILEIKKAKNLDVAIKATKKKIDDYTILSSATDKKIASKRAFIVQFKQQRKELTQDFEKIKELGPKSKCPTCNKIIGKELPDIVKHFTSEISKVGRKIDSTTTLVEKLIADNQKIQKLLGITHEEERSLNKLIKQRDRDLQSKRNIELQIRSEFEKKKKSLKDIQKLGKINYDETIHEKIKNMLSDLMKLDKDRISLEGKASRIPDVKRIISDLQRSISVNSAKIEKILASIRIVGFDEHEYKQARMNESAAEATYHRKDKDLIDVKNDLRNTERDIKTTINQITQENKKRQQIEQEEKKTLILNILDKIFGDFRLDLISRIRPMLMLHASELFRKLTDGKYPNIVIDENYDVQIEDDGKLFPLERFSGGEEDLASLCLRIAISQVIEERSGASAINFIALDEIFGSQDESRRNNILKSLNDLSSQFRQVMVITHIDDVKDLLPYVFNVIETGDKSSKVIPEGSPSLSLTV